MRASLCSTPPRNGSRRGVRRSSVIINLCTACSGRPVAQDPVRQSRILVYTLPCVVNVDTSSLDHLRKDRELLLQKYNKYAQYAEDGVRMNLPHYTMKNRRKARTYKKRVATIVRCFMCVDSQHSSACSFCDFFFFVFLILDFVLHRCFLYIVCA